MKISVVVRRKSLGFHTNTLIDEGAKRGVIVEITDVDSLNNIQESVDNLGDVVIWRSGSLNLTTERTAFIKALKKKHVINRGISTFPFVTHKLFQQKVVEANTDINFIPTYHFKTKEDLISAIDEGLLKYPFIQKPNLGSKGNGVFLMKSIDDINATEAVIKEQVYQNFIKNDGDFRVFMLGGRMLGAIKRVAQGDSFLNNVSKGGKAYPVDDASTLTSLRRVGESISSLFDLQICGVDVIFNQSNQKFYFMEVNTVPQWSGFQSGTGINVAEKIIDYCIDLENRSHKNQLTIIRKTYDENIDNLYSKRFHYASRMYLWTHDEKYLKWLNDYKGTYIGENETDIDAKIEGIVSYDNGDDDDENMRQTVIKKYVNFSKLKKLLFLYTFGKSIYNLDIKENIRKFIPDQQFLDMANLLLQNPEDIALLSTHAANFLYLCEEYLSGQLNLDPDFFINIFDTSYKTNDSSSLRLQGYLLSHCIIGASRFYGTKITKDLEKYREMVKLLEDLIAKNYFVVSLDTKLEVLVCAKLCDYESKLKDLILSECTNSYSMQGNFIVDTVNSRSPKLHNGFAFSEHRNTLYIMSNIDKN